MAEIGGIEEAVNSIEQAAEAVNDKRRRVRPLAKWIADVPRPIEELLPLMANVLEAIAKANATEPRFCSLNPGKVLVRDDLSVQIATHKVLGLGKTFDMGSAKYTYPEIFGEPVLEAAAGANAYIAGFVFYELMQGRKRFAAQFEDVERDGNMGWLAWHADVNRRATSLNEANHYPASVCRIIDRMIEKSPQNRLTDLKGIAHVLRNASNATMAYKVVHDRPSTLADPARKPRTWLANLGKQKLWTSLWRRVAPNEPHLRQRSLEEIERIFQDAEMKFRRFGSIFSFSQSAKRKTDG